MELSIDEENGPWTWTERAVAENPVVILSRSSCCMCHVMRRLLSSIGAHPTVIELDGEEMDVAMGSWALASSPAMFIGGELVGGVESLMELHLAGGLVRKLQEVGAFWT